MTEPLPGPGEIRPPRIGVADLAVQSGVQADEIEAFVARGLIGEPDGDGAYGAGNVTRLRLIKAVLQSGIPMDKLAEAVAEGRLSFDFAGSVVADPVRLAAMTVNQACADAGVSREELHKLMLALGMATPAGDAPIREDDLEILTIFATARNFGLPDQVILGALRSFAISLRRMVDASRELIREHVEEPLLARGMPHQEMFAAAVRTRVALQRMAYRATFLLQRRLFEQAVYDNLIARFEEALEDSQLARGRRAARQTIGFVDLSGFTERTENLGDTQAAAIGAALVDIAQAEATLHNGQLVKPLGDGAMLHFPIADDGVRAALRIVALAREAGLPPARAGIAVGPVVTHDGDYYGRTVNRAARLLDVAGPGQVLVTGDVAEAVGNGGLRFTQLGAVRLRGVDGEVLACVAAEEG